MTNGKAAPRRRVIRGTKNVFADLGFADADVRQAKLRLGPGEEAAAAVSKKEKPKKPIGWAARNWDHSIGLPVTSRGSRRPAPQL